MPGLKRILYVEDEADIRAVAQVALESIGGFTVYLCKTGQEALDTAAAFRPDLLVLDVVMPEMDGPETLKALWKIPDLEATPAIFTTAKTSPEEVADLKSLGALDVISKPFDPMSLSDQITAIWRQRTIIKRS